VICSVPAAGGEVTRLSDLDVHVTLVQATPDGESLMCVASTPTQPFEVWTMPSGGGPLDLLTNSNRELLEAVQIVEPERVTFASTDGWEIEGWLIRPPQSSAPCPLVMHVHGGPHGAYGSTFYYNMQVLAGAGIASVYFNPRGSAGYGETFMRAADWGHKDYQDLMNGVDHVLSLGGIDPERLAVTGGSYGGFMTNWVVGHTDRFACGVAINCLSNLVSFWGTSDIGALWFEQQMGGPFWQRWDQYREHSPLTYVADVTTPLLLIHAENDFRCPIEQSEQMYTALKWLRREVEMVRIPEASHGLANTPKPRHRIERWKLARAWFDRHLGSKEESHDSAGAAAM
jgi:acylaminoacyl-peptidase